MSKNNMKIPKSIEEIMDIYANYEITGKSGDEAYFSVDYLQNLVYYKNPFTPDHKKYYYTKYKSKHYRIYSIFLILSVIFFAIHFIGYYLILNLLGIEVMKNFLLRSILFIGVLSYTIISSTLLARYLNKWNWKTPAAIFPLTIGILFTIATFFGLHQGPAETILQPTFSAAGMAFGPAFLSIFLFYKFHSSITDYGGIHLFFGWIYRISETSGDLQSLNSSFHHLINDLDNWLNITSRILIKNKSEILEGFYFNLISDEVFLEEISRKYRDLFQNVFTGLIVEDILYSDALSYVEEKDKRISSLNRFALEYLSFRLALTQIPKIINLIEKLSSKKIEILYYSTSEKLKKFKSKIISFTIFMLSTLVPLILSLFT